MSDLLPALWFFLPGAYANMAPIFANNIPLLKPYTYPLDHHKSYRGVRIFGDHKTYRGVISGTIFGALTGLVQYLLASNFDALSDIASLTDYTSLSVVALGAAIGFGSLMGDAVKSFFKRQARVAPGKNWIPFDQIDFVVGGLIASLPFVRLEISTYLIILAAAGLLHPAINVLGWMLHLKDKPL